jgi:predicted dehydrogenase
MCLFSKQWTNFLQSNLEFDVVNICTPNGLHAEQAIGSFEA